MSVDGFTAVKGKHRNKQVRWGTLNAPADASEDPRGIIAPQAAC